MGKYSKEQIARIVSFVFLILAFLGFVPQIDAETASTAIQAIIVSGGLLIGVVVDVFGYLKRYKKGDVTLLGARK